MTSPGRKTVMAPTHIGTALTVVILMMIADRPYLGFFVLFALKIKNRISLSHANYRRPKLDPFSPPIVGMSFQYISNSSTLAARRLLHRPRPFAPIYVGNFWHPPFGCHSKLAHYFLFRMTQPNGGVLANRAKRKLSPHCVLFLHMYVIIICMVVFNQLMRMRPRLLV